MLKKFLFFSILTFLPILGLAQISFPFPYCSAQYHDDPAAVDVHLTNVNIETINNSTGSSAYTYYNNMSTDVFVGTEYTVSVTVDGYSAHGVGVWIDFNHNFTFEDDERVMNIVDLANIVGEHTVSFTVPDDAILGNTRMRVRVIEDDTYFVENDETDMLPCNSIYQYTLPNTNNTSRFAYGETEDYLLEVQPNCIDELDSVFSFTYNDKNYDIVKETDGWPGAAACALSKGGTLVEINDQAEQDQIFLQLGLAGITNANTVAPDGGGGAYVWIGGNDMTAEGTWVWDGDGNNLDEVQFWAGDMNGAPVNGLYNNWGNEPDDFGVQDGLALSLDGWPQGIAGEWNDVAINNNLYYIIEYPEEEEEPTGEVIVTSEDDAFLITVDEQTLQMFAETSPTDEDVVWSIELITGNALLSDDGLLTPLEDGVVKVIATAIIDGEETVGYKHIIISNQSGLLTISNAGAVSLPLCTGETGELSAFVDFKAGITGTATFELTGLPTGVDAIITPLELTGDGLVNVIFTNDAGPFVTSNLILTVNLDDPVLTSSVGLELKTYNGIPFYMTAVSPEDNEINVSQLPELDWTDALRAHQYEVQMATDEDFTDIIVTDIEIFESEYIPVYNFLLGTDYYWKVRALNPCGEGLWTPVRKFTIQPEIGVLGCTDENALNYNANADFEDGSCTYPIEGCTDETALNYNNEAVVDDGSCVLNNAALIITEINDTSYNLLINANIPVTLVTWDLGDGSPTTYGQQINHDYPVNGVYPIEVYVYSAAVGATYYIQDTIVVEAWGCTDPFAVNFDLPAAYDDGSCIPKVYGCTNPLSTNYNPNANTDDGSCSTVILGCTDETAFNYNPDATNDDGSCEEVVLGCTDETALNYDANANTDDGSCDVTGCTDPDAFNYNPDATVNDGSCIDVILGCTDVNALNYNPNVNTNDGTCLYDAPNDTDWQVTTTSENHSILIQNSIDFSGITPALVNGDYIGVFFTKNNGDLQCAGRVEWTGSNLALSAFGNENGQDNGFEDGEVFIWKIWRSNTNMDTEVSASYDATQTHQGEYGDDGISALTALSLGITHEIELEEGWNFISTNLSPVNPLMDSVFSTVNGSLFLAKDENGDVYWPNVNVNNIGDHIMGEAYKVNMNADATLEIKGITISPEDYDVTLNEGWSYIGYLRDANANISSVMASVADKIFLMKNIDGDVFWPQFNINNIGNMEIGAGYQINMSADTTFNFPANSVNLPELKLTQKESPLYYSNVFSSKRHMHIAIPVNAWENTPSIGSEIAVYSNETLVGATVWNGGNTVVTIYGHDQNLWDNKGLVVKAYMNGEESNLDVVLTSQKALTFIENDVRIVNEIAKIANPEFNYQLVEKELVVVATSTETVQTKSIQLEIVDYLGRKVYADQLEVEGNQSIILPELVKGQYIINIKENDLETTPIKWMNF